MKPEEIARMRENPYDILACDDCRALVLGISSLHDQLKIIESHRKRRKGHKIYSHIASTPERLKVFESYNLVISEFFTTRQK